MDMKNIHFLSGQLTGSGHVRCVQPAQRLGCTYGNILDPIPPETKVLVVVQRKLPEHIRPGIIVVADVLDRATDIIDKADAIIVPSEHAKRLIQPRHSNIFVITNHHMNTENYIVDYTEDNIGNVGYIGYVNYLKNPPESMECNFSHTQISTTTGIKELVYPLLNRTDVMWNFRPDKFNTDFKTAAKSKNAMSWGIPSINPPEPATLELTPKGCVICDYGEAEEYYYALSTNRGYYKSVREEGLEEAKQYHIDVIIEKYKAMFKELLGG